MLNQKLFKIADSLGIKVIFGKELLFEKRVLSLEMLPNWLVMNPNSQAREIQSQLAHELGHFLVAPKSRKYRKDYGISQKYNRNDSYWNFDEEKAIRVEIELLKSIGITRKTKIYRYPNLVEKWWNEIGQQMVAVLLLIK